MLYNYSNKNNYNGFILSTINFFTTNDAIAELLSVRIKNERIAQKLKQEQLAQKAGVKIGIVRNFEQYYKITLLNLIAILRALEKEEIFNELFDFEKERIEVDAFKYQEEIAKKKKQRVYDAK